MTLPRTEFGFARTEGACEQFVDCCEILPAYLVPSDIEAIAAHLGYDDLIQFAMENLLASSGAIVRLWQKLARIPTLVPQRKPDHTCKFLDTDKRCAIHAVSPFGFQYFDCRMSQREDDLRSSRGLRAIAREWMRRLFDGQLITADDMRSEQEYFREKLRRHNRYLHGWGVVCGCEVKPSPTKDKPFQVVICPGYVITPFGDEIMIGTPALFDLATCLVSSDDPCALAAPCPPVTSS